MMDVGEQVYIQSFKHDGSLHRTWAKATVLEHREDCLVVVTYKAMVSESNGRVWQTREPAICFFYPDKWYNIISMIRKRGVTYYCNVASPYLYDGEAIKNIDYDLDLKVYPNGSYDILDEDEFARHGMEMNYSLDIQKCAWDSLRELVDLARDGSKPFDEETIAHYYHMYLGLDRKRLKSTD